MKLKKSGVVFFCVNSVWFVFTVNDKCGQIHLD